MSIEDGPHSDSWWTVPSGILAHTVEGEHRRIDKQDARFDNAIPLCNRRINFTYIKNSGELWFSEGTINDECMPWGEREAYGGPESYEFGKDFQKTCAELWVSGELRAKQCHGLSGSGAHL